MPEAGHPAPRKGVEDRALAFLPGTDLTGEPTDMLTRTRKAFTLLELIVVIVILGILALLAIPTFAKVISKSQLATANETAGAVARDATALAAFDQAGYGGGPAGNTYLDQAAAEVGSAGQVSVTTEYSSASNSAVLSVNQGGHAYTCTLTGTSTDGTAPVASCS